MGGASGRSFSVPMIALTPVYEVRHGASARRGLSGHRGRAAECGWYYWESKPVYSVCIYSDAFRDYLMERCEAGVDLGMDVVNLDEVMTSIGLMNRDPRGIGVLQSVPGPLPCRRSRTELTSMDDDALVARSGPTTACTTGTGASTRPKRSR